MQYAPQTAFPLRELRASASQMARFEGTASNRGEHIWMVPLGNGDAIRNHPMLKDPHLPPLGGDANVTRPLVTKTLLISALLKGGTNNGPRVVARDRATGQEIASVDLPASAIGTPMTYIANGKQFIALTIGSSPVPELVALALPQSIPRAARPDREVEAVSFASRSRHH